MADLKSQIETLIEQGAAFTYESFATTSGRGYAEAYKPEWIVWRQRAQDVATQLGRHNAAAKAIIGGLSIPVLGFGFQEFNRARSFILNGLYAATELINDIPIGTASSSEPAKKRSNRVFIVHGHDHVAKTDLEIYLKELGLEPVVLHRQADEGKTVIEKFEKHSDVGFAFILLTPDEIAYPITDDGLDDSARRKERRARPNVVLELGYFIGRLGRQNVCCLYTGGVDLPSDVRGILYKEFHHAIKEVFYDIRKELISQQYKLS